MKHNEAKIRTAFDLRFRRSSDGATDKYRYVVDVMNQMLRQRVFSKLKRRARKRKRLSAEQMDESVYGMEKHGTHAVDIYGHIRRISTSHLAMQQ